MKTLLSAIALVLAIPGAGLCESCDTMAKQLAEVRNEFHKYATGDEAQKKLMTFDELAAKLDEIIEVKKKMRQGDCRIPSRSAKLDLDRYSTPSAERAKKKRKSRKKSRHRR